MYTVISQHLSKDGTTADLQFGSTNHGELSSAEFITFLRRFREAGGPDVAAAELAVTSPGGACTIRNLAGKLVVRSTRDGYARDLYFSPEDIVDHLDRSTTWTPFEPAVTAVPAQPRAIPRIGPTSPVLASAAFAFGLGILVYAIHAASLSVPATAPLVLAAPGEPAADQAARLKNAVGTFATGEAPGDRVIVVGQDQSVQFYEVGPAGPADVSRDTVHLARHDQQECLATRASGVIDLVSSDSLVYCRDLYLRTR